MTFADVITRFNLINVDDHDQSRAEAQCPCCGAADQNRSIRLVYDEVNRKTHLTTRCSHDKAAILAALDLTDDDLTDAPIRYTPEEVIGRLEVAKNKGPKKTYRNALVIMQLDQYFAPYYRSAISNDDIKVTPGGEYEKLTTDDVAHFQLHIEDSYGLQLSEDYVRTALRNYFTLPGIARYYNPILEKIKETKWDGRPRVKEFLAKWSGTEADEYAQEVSRLIFASAIHRAAEPGCEIAETVIFYGEQGCGKSTICKELAMNSSFYNSVKTFAGQAGYEAINGKWICELEELAPFHAKGYNAIDEDYAKSFLTTPVDTYRGAFQRDTIDRKRCNIFIGTTNRAEYLTDDTGNRRFIPFTWGYKENEGAIIWECRIDELRADVRQCWAEIYQAYLEGSDLADPFFSKSYDLQREVEQRRAAFTEVDPWVAVIDDYLNPEDGHPKTKTSAVEIYYDALYSLNNQKDPGREDTKRIRQIMLQHFKWEPHRSPEQRYIKRLDRKIGDRCFTRPK